MIATFRMSVRTWFIGIGPVPVAAQADEFASIAPPVPKRGGKIRIDPQLYNVIGRQRFAPIPVMLCYRSFTPEVEMVRGGFRLTHRGHTSRGPDGLNPVPARGTDRLDRESRPWTTRP